ncbi:LemA family protein [Patescibacteria group bacterium]|nr:LemA family protein [Patescibacteria group bacterium]MBU4265395.1 LemA family protein [Patescibacteria group bacterium]MBU4390347.1 LemA family protein [Patescibacteria group bacterium]MBU4396594.1 LemA family protein [Patescibacteria group bacterium]MBU4431084.1 LemA family protein [Patescibacteria group bacterium]
MKKTLLIIAGVLVFGGMWGVSTYNGLIGKSEGIDNQWSQVETQYQRRFDLIPNLVKSAEAVMKQERDVFESIAEARTRYAGAGSVNEKTEAMGQIESSLGRLLVIMENYPELKSDETVQRLMDELAGTENRVSVERKRFNDLVTPYNVEIKQFPKNLIAGMLGFEERSFFEAVEEAEKAPSVEFDLE